MNQEISLKAKIATAILFTIPINVIWGIINGIRLIFWYDDYLLKVFIMHVAVYVILWVSVKLLSKRLKDEKEKASQELMEAKKRLSEVKEELAEREEYARYYSSLSEEEKTRELFKQRIYKK